MRITLLMAFVGVTGMRLIYKEPVFSMQNPNFTLGGLFELTYSTGQVNVAGFDRAIAMMCTLKEYNEGYGQGFQVDGIFNVLIYDAGGSLAQSEYAAVKLLEYNLQNETENQTVAYTGEDVQIGAIIAGIDTDIFFATQHDPPTASHLQSPNRSTVFCDLCCSHQRHG